MFGYIFFFQQKKKTKKKNLWYILASYPGSSDDSQVLETGNTKLMVWIMSSLSSSHLTIPYQTDGF